MAMQEKEVFDDVLASQKFITEMYNTFANECATPNIRDEFMNILNEEHQIQADVFDEMKKRGWYPTPQAQQQNKNSRTQILNHKRNPFYRQGQPKRNYFGLALLRYCQIRQNGSLCF